MAITGSVGSYRDRTRYLDSHKTAGKRDYFQTAGSGATTAALKIIGSATTADEYFITSLHVSVLKDAAAAGVVIHACSDIIGQIPTATTGDVNFSFGEMGLMIGTVAGTTTATVTLQAVASGSCTMYFVCTGYKLV